MRRILIFTVMAAVLITAGGNELFAQRGTSAAQGGSNATLEIKLASPLPENSPWGRTLERIKADWNRITRGQVRVRVMHSYVGSEALIQQTVKGNTIQAAIFTSFGLSAIYPGIMTMSAPFFIRTDDELDAVMKEVQPFLESQVNAGDFFIVAWSRAGFVNIFSKDPIFTPDDLRKLKIASNPEAAGMNTAFKTMGFQVVEADWNNLNKMPGLEAIYQHPAAVAAANLQRTMKNMLPINIAPFVGGIVINQETWKRIGALNPRYQEELLQSTRRIAEEFDAAMQQTVSNSIQSMARQGLTVNRLSQAQEQIWYSDVERVTPGLLRNNTYDPELYGKINDALVKFRSGR